MKLKPYKTIGKAIRQATKGFGTDELALLSDGLVRSTEYILQSTSWLLWHPLISIHKKRIRVECCQEKVVEEMFALKR